MFQKIKTFIQNEPVLVAGATRALLTILIARSIIRGEEAEEYVTLAMVVLNAMGIVVARKQVTPMAKIRRG